MLGHPLRRLTALSIIPLMGCVSAQAEDSFFRMQMKSPVLFSGAGSEDDVAPPSPTPLQIVLQASSPFEATRGKAIDSIDLRHFAAVSGTDSVTVDDLTWSLSDPADLPPGIALEGHDLVGTPNVSGQFAFEVVAQHIDADDREVYTIIVNGAMVNVVDISIGVRHGCALTVSGEVLCWGSNAEGAVGRPGSNSILPVPVALPEGISIASIDAGYYHSCAITTTQTAFCWGRGTSGQLGSGQFANSDTPLPVLSPSGSSALTGVTQLATGGTHTCAITTSQGTVCWGENSNHRLGNGNADNSALPTRVLDANGIGYLNATSISASFAHTCTIVGSGSAFCWGQNNAGQIGVASSSEMHFHLPRQVLGAGGTGFLANVKSIHTGSNITCAHFSDSIACWGNGLNGELGTGSAEVVRYPTFVRNQTNTAPLAGIASLEVGAAHACATLNSGNILCWGQNSFGQLGTASTSSSSLPTPVLNSAGTTPLSGFPKLFVANFNTCASNSAGSEILCWGRNTENQLSATGGNRNLPLDISSSFVF